MADYVHGKTGMDYAHSPTLTNLIRPHYKLLPQLYLHHQRRAKGFTQGPEMAENSVQDVTQQLLSDTGSTFTTQPVK